MRRKGRATALVTPVSGQGALHCGALPVPFPLVAVLAHGMAAVSCSCKGHPLATDTFLLTHAPMCPPAHPHSALHPTPQTSRRPGQLGCQQGHRRRRGPRGRGRSDDWRRRRLP